jgi:predicted NBD/HSP70 family sugar kinase
MYKHRLARSLGALVNVVDPDVIVLGGGISNISSICDGGGGLLLAGMLFGAIRSDLGLMAAAVSLLLGGIVAWGSNASTAKEATKELAAAESKRAALIEQLNPRVIS